VGAVGIASILAIRWAVVDIAGHVNRGPAPFANCSEARAAGRENIPLWDSAYRPTMDGDQDGIACESGWRRR
jgi:hypothetical protein